MASEKQNPQQRTGQRISVEKIIDIVRTARNDRSKDFLNDDFLNSYYQEKFNKSLSAVKKEFVKRDLKELLTSPLDLRHYAGLINELKKNGEESIGEKSFHYIDQEIDKFIGKYSI